MFADFNLTDYTYLAISRGGVAGDVITSQTNAQGIYKQRTGMTQSNNQEMRESNSTLHIKPDECFVNNLIGNGIRVAGKDYEIVGATAGDDYDTERLFYRLTLQATDFSDYAS